MTKSIHKGWCRSSHSDHKKSNYSISGSSVCQFLHHHYLSSLGKLGPYLSSLQQLHTINTHLCPDPLPLSLISPSLSLSSLSLLFFLPKRGDTAINLRVANELHLTIKCTGNGTFHLQEDQWQWQTLFSERLVSGMMFRRQSNQSPHTDAEINQRRKRKKEEKDLKLFSSYCIHGLYLARATNHSLENPPSCPLISCTFILSFSLYSNFVSPSFSL